MFYETADRSQGIRKWENPGVPGAEQSGGETVTGTGMSRARGRELEPPRSRQDGAGRSTLPCGLGLSRGETGRAWRTGQRALHGPSTSSWGVGTVERGSGGDAPRPRILNAAKLPATREVDADAGLLAPKLRRPREAGLCQHVGGPQRGAHGEGTRCLQAEGIPGGPWWRAEGAGGVQHPRGRAAESGRELLVATRKTRQVNRGTDLLQENESLVEESKCNPSTEYLEQSTRLNSQVSPELLLRLHWAEGSVWERTWPILVCLC